jgi:hypothetical protein
MYILTTINFNIILTLNYVSSNWSVLFKFYVYNFVQIVRSAARTTCTTHFIPLCFITLLIFACSLHQGMQIRKELRWNMYISTLVIFSVYRSILRSSRKYPLRRFSMDAPKGIYL